jgi:stress response protein SCP2
MNADRHGQEGKAMQINDHKRPQHRLRGEVEVDVKEIVMGLHWDPPEDGATGNPANLDALCVLFDAQDRVLEVIHPGHPANANGSVLHTGDSPTGASEWDDERIFVFLEALPETVAGLAFVVASPGGHAFSEVPGASCHVSDRITEREWVRVELTALDRRTAHCVATLRRSPTRWTISPDAQTLHGEIEIPGKGYLLFQESKR